MPWIPGVALLKTIGMMMFYFENVCQLQDKCKSSTFGIKYLFVPIHEHFAIPVWKAGIIGTKSWAGWPEPQIVKWLKLIAKIDWISSSWHNKLKKHEKTQRDCPFPGRPGYMLLPGCPLLIGGGTSMLLYKPIMAVKTYSAVIGCYFQ